MADENNKERNIADQFPELPKFEDVPDVPKISPSLPKLPSQSNSGDSQPGGYKKIALASTAATSFIGPIIVMTIIGLFLDKKFGHGQGLFVVGAIILGFIVGVTSLMTVLKKL